MSSSRVRGGVGPLEPFREGFRGFLAAEGYASKSIELRLALLSHVSCWMEERELASSELGAVGDDFFLERRRRYAWLKTTRSLVPLRRYLALIGALSSEAAPAATPSCAAELIERYRRYMERERGLAAGSIELYLRQVRRLVAAWWPDGEVRAGALDAAAVIAVGRREAARGASQTKTVACALRSFLRFLYAVGLTERPLTEAGLPARARLAVLHHHDLLVRGPASLPGLG